MPLIQGCSKEAVDKNIAKLVDEGYSRKQAAAIAYDVARDNLNKCGEKRQQELEQGGGDQLGRHPDVVRAVQQHRPAEGQTIESERWRVTGIEERDTYGYYRAIDKERRQEYQVRRGQGRWKVYDEA